ncbi:MAG: glycosyltransferase, partial [Ignavibacteria bacterium]|nr:glycosyltransferase [Ignavibacteria bacterium]
MKIAMLLDNPFTNDRRVYREAKTLIDAGYDLTMFATKDKGLLEKETIDGIPVERIFPEDTYYNLKLRPLLKSIAADLIHRGFNIFHCHDHNMLQVGAFAKQQKTSSIIILDSHELFHLMPNNPIDSKDRLVHLKIWVARKIQNSREKRNSKYIDYLITVNDSLAIYLGKYFKVKNTPVVIRNIPEYAEAVTGSNIIREKFNIPAENKILVFIGANIFTKTLNLEQVMDEVGNQPNI